MAESAGWPAELAGGALGRLCAAAGTHSKTNTIHAWNTWQTPETKDEPTVWFHDIFRQDGSPFDAKEVEYIKRITGKGTKN